MWVTESFIETWKSGRHVGPNRPHSVVEVGRHKFRRDYSEIPDDLRINAFIPGESGDRPWWPYTFQELDPFVELPQVKQVDFQNGTDQNGLQVATVIADNVGYVEQTGALGHVYRTIEPGFMAPYRGYTPPTRAAGGMPAENEWFDVVTEMATIRIWQGFGEPERELDGSIPLDGGPNGGWVFFGTIDDVDPDSGPTTLTITARMGAVLTDQRIFGWNKSNHLRDPVTFRDRLEAQDEIPEGTNPKASSTRQDITGFSTAYVIDKDTDAQPTYWQSDDTTEDGLEWIQIKVPQGRYRSVIIDAPEGVEIYIGVYPYNLSDGDPPTQDDLDIAEREWATRGFGEVPGANGGWEYVRHDAEHSGGEVTYELGAEWELGPKSVIRVGITNLTTIDGGFRAQVRRLHAVRRKLSREVARLEHIIIDDLSDMVKVALRWAGYQEWEVEQTGIRIPGKLVFNRSDFLIDVINKAKELTGFTFFVADPTNGLSHGVPTFRRPSALLRQTQGLIELRDDQNLFGAKPKISQEPRGYIIRVRGKEATMQHGGRTLGGDKVRRIMNVYRPPWTTDRSMAGIVKHVTYQNPAIRTELEVQMACFLIAVEEALAAVTMVCECPGNPYVELDDQVGVFDVATGTNTRMLVTGRTMTMTLGERTTWEMTLSGPSLDSPDLVTILEHIEDPLNADGLSDREVWSSDTPNPVQSIDRELRIRE